VSGSDDRREGGRLGSQVEALHTVRTALTETERLVHELQIHQIELEIQNRALREAQEELDSSRQRFLELFEFAPMAYLAVESDGKVVEANLAASEMFGLERALLLGRRLQTVVGMTDPLAFRSLLRAAAEQGNASRAELTFRTVAQQILVVEAVAAPVGRGRLGQIRLAVHDVTARAVAEQNLAFLSQAGARLNRIGLGTPQLLDEIAAAGAFGPVDGCWAEMNGLESVAWRTESLRRRMLGEQLQALRRQIDSCIHESRSSGSVTHGRWTEELGARPTWQPIGTWVTAPLRAQGKIEGTVTLFLPLPPEREEPARALTEEFARRASMIMANAALYRRAEEASRSREEIMAVLAHDLSNALFSFRLHSQRGLSRGGEHAQRALAVIARGSQWLLGLVKTLLDVAGMEDGAVKIQRHPGDLSPVLESACLLQQIDADERRLQIVRTWPEELPLEFDQERIVQVLFNLMNNAVKFTPPGGRIEVGACREAGQIRLWVQDSGRGLAPAELEHVFERGWQADPKAGGKGLGLYISRRIVEAHGGTMWVESTPGRGTTFQVVLPSEATETGSLQDEAAVTP
jgi:PAS domain S-box-containing protein